MLDAEFDAVIVMYRDALQSIVKGDTAPVLALFSQQEDVTLANPLGPAGRGPAEVAEVTAHAASHFHEGHNEFDEISRYVDGNLGYLVQLEQVTLRLAGAEETSSMSLRATTIFRREEDGWRIVHRHADGITTPRPISTILSD